MDASSLVVPIGLTGPFGQEASLQSACSNAEPTSLVSWGYEDLDDSLEDEMHTKSKGPRYGAVLGCADGSLYVFHPDTSRYKSSRRRSTHSSDLSMFTTSLSVSHRYPHHLSITYSRGTSPTSSKANLTLSASKSRAVSGLSKEQIEAPKNYVDFDEEQVKLKGMVNEKSVRDRGFMEGLVAQFERAPTSKTAVLQHTGTKEHTRRRSEDLISLNSPSTDSYTPAAPLSPTSSPSSPIPGTTPPLASTGAKHRKLALYGRILLQHYGEGHGVSGMEVLQDGELVLVLQESGFLSLCKTRDGLCVVDAETGRLPPGSKSVPDANLRSVTQPLWTWVSLHVLQRLHSDTTLVVAVSNISAETAMAENGNTGGCRICVFKFEMLNGYEFGETKLEKIGDVTVDACAEYTGVGLDDEENITVYSLSPSSPHKLTSRTLRINHPSHAASSNSADSPIIAADGQRQPHHQLLSASTIPDKIKGLASRAGVGGSHSPKQTEEGQKPEIVSEEEKVVSEVAMRGNLLGVKVEKHGDRRTLCIWSDEEVQVFELATGGLWAVADMSIRETKDVSFVSDSSLRVFAENKISTYNIAVTARASAKHDITPISTVEDVQHPFTTAGTRILTTRKGKTGQREISSRKFDSDKNSPVRSRSQSPGKTRKRRCLWSASEPMTLAQGDDGQKPRVTAMLPLELTEIVLGYSNGIIRKTTLPDLLILDPASLPNPPHDNTLQDAAILNLFLVHNERTQVPIVVGGGDDGSIAFWELSTLRLCSRWIVFTEPLAWVVHIKEKDVDKGENGERATTRRRLCGSSFCVSRDGTVAVIAIDGFEFLYVIPGSSTPLRRLCLGENDLLLFYADGRTRMWDVKTREFWRSMSAEKASEMLKQGGWFDSTVGDKKPSFNSQLSEFNKANAMGDPPPAMFVDFVMMIQSFLRTLNGNDVDDVAVADQVRALLSTLYAPGLDDLVEECRPLEIPDGRLAIGHLDSRRNSHWHNYASPIGVWQKSPETTAARLLCVVSLVNVLRTMFGKDALTSAHISKCISSLPIFVGSTYQPPDLAFLALHWGESPVLKIRESAGAIFESEVQRLQDDEVTAIVEKWQHRLPCVLPDSQKQSTTAALALNLCGSIATVKYQLLSATTLSDIARSITIYLYNDASPHRTLAIELCSRGFDIWQHYFDAMDALRSLFTLATTSRKDAISVRNPGQQARMAVMRIASSNSPLFMTTLSLDILHPRSVEYTATIMQVLAFLIKRNPMVLYPSLPRLLEAVVKSLDPSSSADREAVLDAATEILGQVVRTFPTVDFHTESQRLAVGSSEGAVIMYDLKTATRLYVLEGHRKRLAGISFSPDGRRLVTLCLEENVVLVWKVGSSFTSFFHPGAPPRQGHGGSDPYKTLNFMLAGGVPGGKDGLEQVSFEWTNNRSVRVKIYDTTLTFNT